MTLMNIYSHFDKLNKLFLEKECLHPDRKCSGKIIRSHTIQKRKALSKIAVNGHVYQLKHNISDLKNKYIAIKPQLIGYNEATTYYGFCENHDNELFSPIDNDVYSNEIYQNFLYSYRALCKEVYLRVRTLNAFPEFEHYKNTVGDTSFKHYQLLKDTYTIPHMITAKVLSEAKSIYDNMLLTSNYNNLESFVIYFNKTPSVLCNSIFFPSYWLGPNKLDHC